MLSQVLQPAVRLVDRLRGMVPAPVEPAVTEDPAAQPWAAGDGPDGVLVVHGYTGTPQAVRPWAEHLVAAGFTVSLPRLPGHGTHWRDLNATRWTDWYAQVDGAFAELSERCDRVFLAGLSMGGALALRLAEQHGDAVAGLTLVNPAIHVEHPALKVLPVLRHLVPSLAAITNDIADPAAREVGYDRNPLQAMHSQTQLWADVVAHLGLVTQPLLVYRSAQDHIVDASSVELLRREVASTDVEVRTLTRSYHVATLDYEAEEIFAGSVEFFRRLSA